MPLILHTGLSVHKEKMIKEMRLTVKDFCQHSTNTLSVMKAKYKKELLKRAKHSPMREKRIFSTSTVSSAFKSKEVDDISVINLENNKNEDSKC